MTEEQFQKKSQGLLAEVEEVVEALRPHFSRSEASETAGAYLKALLSSVERKNTWQMAETVGRKTPYAFQHLLGRSHWDCGAVRDEHIQRTMNGLGARSGILAVDETGFLKKGKKSAGVARQYSGTAGRIENCQIGVFLSWKTKKGQTLLDRELYLPKEWSDDPERCLAAGIPKNVAFQTKPQLARQMIERVRTLGVKPAWVTADETYGHDGKFRFWLEEIGQPYVVAIPSNQSITRGFEQLRVSALLEKVKDDAWIKLSAGLGSKGPRLYEWSHVPINHAYGKKWTRTVLFRRSLTHPSEVGFYIAFCSSKKASLENFIMAAGSRWSIEECFESSKGEVGLDQYEVRSHGGWYRHMTLVMIAHSLLVTTRARLFAPPRTKKSSSLAQFKKKRNLSPLSASAFRKSDVS